jgi:hypothetical protein
MADVQIQSNPPETRSGGSGAVWAIVVIVLLLLIGWFVFRGGLNRSSRTDININTPSGQTGGGTPATPSGGGTGGGTKTP